ncbi:flagellar protein FlaG [Desulfosporosinus shakirovi]|uniref:flagellar protein FlaG n=1 Tax=Desulfosporosinus shakirovi TaxID=2885154 RepID=UPI001E4392E1|nr:flagellar protein FlaG [Desulfosporosinus sp. SRJS8]MCB8814147.1 flagellar protein FlaG [Desulfosporosinus sp. SRJS8]
MDISVVKAPIDFGGSANLAQTNSIPQPFVSVPTGKSGDITDKSLTTTTDDKVHKNPGDLQEVTQLTEAINKFVKAMDTNIHFEIHKGTNQLMVQVVDQDTNKVLKEFPPTDFLDTIAAIRDYVGILLDKKI